MDMGQGLGKEAQPRAPHSVAHLMAEVGLQEDHGLVILREAGAAEA